jgi:hypothetical protein
MMWRIRGVAIENGKKEIRIIYSATTIYLAVGVIENELTDEEAKELMLAIRAYLDAKSSATKASQSL